MIQLSAKWGSILKAQPETGMGYQLATVTLADGRTFAQTMIVEGRITSVGDAQDIPFSESEIVSIIVDHGR